MNPKLAIAFGCLFLLLNGKAKAQAPVTDFSATPTSGCGPLSVQFKDLSANGPLFWIWDFGNGATSTAQNPAVTYNNPGTYTVTLTTRNKEGETTTQKTGYIVVYPYPRVSFTTNLGLACSPANIQFTDRSTSGQGTLTSWTWSFGDGTTSNDQNPAHIYTQTGYYSIGLSVTNSGGCTYNYSAKNVIRIIDGIQPNFDYRTVSTSCTAPYTLNFTNQSAGPGNLTYNWSLGNGALPANSTDTNPSGVTYPADGSYTVSLLVQSNLGCSQSIQKTIPLSGYTAAINGPSAACVNSPVTFTNASTPPPASMTWDFGDGTGATVSPATKSWPAIGSYTVKIVNRYATCSDSTTRTVQVLNPPVAAFIADHTTACKPNLTVQFTDKSTGSPTQWLWDFGDGQTSTDQNPVHTYTTSGPFDVRLTVTNTGSCSNTATYRGYITIQPPTVAIRNNGDLGACVAGSGNLSSVSPQLIVSTIDPVTSYNWQAPGSVEGSSTSAAPTFTYNATGSYTISVTVTTAGGCTSQPAAAPVSIGTPAAGAVDFTIHSPDDPNNGYVCGRDPVTFTAVGPPATYYNWDFGDGSAADHQTVTSISHSYDQSHTNPPAAVTLSLVNNGCQTKVTHTLVVNQPFPGFIAQVTCGTRQVVFTDSSKVNSPIYDWNFGDGTPHSNAKNPPPHIYPSLQPYTVTLTITDGVCTQSIPKTVLLAQVSPDFTDTASAICKQTDFILRSTTAVSPVPPDQFIQSYIWRFSPTLADTTAGPNDTTSITARGTYNTTLTAIDVNGCPWISPAKAITIIGPVAHFTSIPGACKNSPASFTDNSTPDAGATITSWSWNFGDGQTGATGPAISHAYADTGYFRTTLKVTGSDGCFDTYTQPDSIQITAPTANFGGPDSFYCPGVPLVFKDSSQGYGLSHSWTYGDGQSDTILSHIYATPGQTYNATLTVKDEYGCTSSITKPVTIRQPVAAFDISDTTAICVPLETHFSSHSQYYDSLYWAFGDGSTSTLPVTAHFYNKTDTFIAKLYVRGPGGCLDSAQRRVLVLDPFAITQVQYGPLHACDSVPVNFSLTVPGYTNFTLFFADGAADSSGSPTPFHMYRHPNSYIPYVQLQDKTGCLVYIGGKVPVTVLGAIPFFTVSKHALCDSSIINLTDYTTSNNGIDSETYSFTDGSPAETQTPGTGKFNITKDFAAIGTWPIALKVTTDSGCTETYTDTVKVYQTPHPSITMVSDPCAGIIQFKGSIDAPPIDTINWNWNFGNGQTSKAQNPVLLMNPGSYKVTLITSVSFGCSDTATDNVTIHPLPVIKGPKEITTPLGFPVTIPFTYSNDVVNYDWYPPTNLDCPTCPNPVATLVLTTQYQVTVSDSNNCRATDSILIKTICNNDNIFMPNTFSPNGDGVNDVFYPRGKSLYNVQSLSVFNRWGQMVFQRRDFPANSQEMGWDGTVNGRPAPPDAYVYIVEVICDNAQLIAIHGTVTLVR